MNLDVLRRRAWPIAIVSALLLGGTIGLAIPPAMDKTSISSREPAWSLPPLRTTVRDDSSLLAQVRKSGMWNAIAAGGQAGANWKLVGVVDEGGTRVALLQVEGQDALLRVAGGDSLPGDGKVVDVGRYGMRIDIFGCENLILRLYTPGQRSPAADCGYAVDTVSAGPRRNVRRAAQGGAAAAVAADPTTAPARPRSESGQRERSRDDRPHRGKGARRAGTAGRNGKARRVERP